MLKQDFRKIQKNALNLHIKHSFKRDFAVLKECLKIIKKLKAKRILFYCALPYEPNLLKFRHILSKNCQIFVPFMQGVSFKSVKYRLPLMKKRFGVMEPPDSFLINDIDLAVVPVIGVDKNFKRIGHGYGFYDRFFDNINQNISQNHFYKRHKIKVIFVQIINAKINANLSEKHDMAGDFYITPFKKYEKSKK